MSNNIRRCWKCLTIGDAVDRRHGWLHCPICDQVVGHVPATPEVPEYLKPPRHAMEVPPAYVYTADAPSFADIGWNIPGANAEPPAPTNPKTLMGRQKLSMLSVVPPASIICEAEAMHYGAFEAPRKDGQKGYGPYNWRDDPVEMMIYIDACLRHLLALVDGEELDRDSGKPHLGHAKACLGIIADAQENSTLIDDRPAVRKGAASSMLAIWKRLQSTQGEPK
jgi:hypothetical protein